MAYKQNNQPALHVVAGHLPNEVRTREAFATQVAQRRSWDVHDRKRQLMALQQRYLEADDYNRPAVKLLLRNVVDGLGGERT